MPFALVRTTTIFPLIFTCVVLMNAVLPCIVVAGVTAGYFGVIPPLAGVPLLAGVALLVCIVPSVFVVPWLLFVFDIVLFVLPVVVGVEAVPQAARHTIKSRPTSSKERLK